MIIPIITYCDYGDWNFLKTQKDNRRNFMILGIIIIGTFYLLWRFA